MLIRDGAEHRDRAVWLAMLAAAIWMLHPLHVSTTLYVVQRMSILATLFSLVGLLGYIHGRSLLAIAPKVAYGWMTLTVILCTVLAILSKENGAILPLLVLVVEYTVLRHGGLPKPKPRNWWVGIFLWGPVALIVVYFAFQYIPNGGTSGYQHRPFTMAQRLLTESRVLLDYLYHLLIPQMQTRGLFNEDYPLSIGLVRPFSTAFALAGVASLVLFGLSVRRALPVISLAILFFCGGHVIESTVVPLEIYFEHRNYLPSIFLFLPIPYYLITCVGKTQPKLIGAALMIGIPAFMTAQQAQIWSSEINLALSWAEANPTSARAQRVASMALDRSGRRDLALARLESATRVMPADIEVRLHYLALKCLSRGVSQEEIKQVLNLLRDVPYDFRTFNLLERIVDIAPSAGCVGIGRANTHAMLDALAMNPGAQKSNGPKRQIHYLRGLLYAQENNAVAAFREFETSLDLVPDVEAALKQSAILATHKMYEEALKHLGSARRLLPSNPDRPNRLLTIDRQADIEYLQEQIESSMNTDPVN
jgi:hypothetical protein